MAYMLLEISSEVDYEKFAAVYRGKQHLSAGPVMS